MTQESKHSQSSNNSETRQEKKSNNTITKKSNLELELKNEVDIIENMLMRGVTLSEILEDKKLSVSQMSLQKFYAILKKDKELNHKIVEARKIGIQTLIDKWLQIFQYQEIENPNQINKNPSKINENRSKSIANRCKIVENPSEIITKN